MATLNPQHTDAFSAAVRALDAAIDGALDYGPDVVSGTTFVPADLAGTGRISAYRRLGPVTIVDANGNETRLRQDRTREMLAGVVVVGLMLWAASR